jgi:hypothetical protein
MQASLNAVDISNASYDFFCSDFCVIYFLTYRTCVRNSVTSRSPCTCQYVAFLYFPLNTMNNDISITQVHQYVCLIRRKTCFGVNDSSSHVTHCDDNAAEVPAGKSRRQGASDNVEITFVSWIPMYSCIFF